MDSLSNTMISCNDTSGALHTSDMLPRSDTHNIFTVMSSMLLFLILSLGGLMQIKIKQLSNFILVELDMMSNKIVHNLLSSETDQLESISDNEVQHQIAEMSGK